MECTGRRCRRLVRTLRSISRGHDITSLQQRSLRVRITGRPVLSLPKGCQVGSVAEATSIASSAALPQRLAFRSEREKF